jgi:hypothetical protein
MPAGRSQRLGNRLNGQLSSVVGFILDAHGPRAGYAFAAACGAASAVTCLLGLRRLRSPRAAA